MKAKMRRVFGVLVLIVSIPLLLYYAWIIIGSTVYAIKVGQSSGTGMGQMFGLIGILFFAGLSFVGYYLLTGKDLK